MLLDSVVHFTKAASVTRQLVPKTSRHSVPKSIVSHLFGGIDITHKGVPHILDIFIDLLIMG